MKQRSPFLSFAVLLAVLAIVPRLAAQPVTFSFSGYMEGNSIFAHGTQFSGSFTYVYPQAASTNGAYLLQSYTLTIQGESLPIPPAVGFGGATISVGPLAGTNWNEAPVNNLAPSITVSNGIVDSFGVFIQRLYTMELAPGRVRLGGPRITLSDSTGRVFQDASLPNLPLVADQFTSGRVSISYSVDAGSSETQTGIITSLVPKNPSFIDSDGDGVNDYREGKDGTDPTNATSFDSLSKGLMVYYPFDANVLDDSGNTNNLVLSLYASLQTSDRAGSFGRALAIQPLPQNAVVTDSDALAVGQRPSAVSSRSIGITGKAPRTVSFWASVKTLPVWNNGTFLQWGKESGGYFGLQYASRSNRTVFLTDKNLVWDAGNGGAGIVTAPTNLTQTWRHFALTYDGETNVTFYLDGAKQDGSFAAQDLGLVNTIDTTLRVGVGVDGSLDELRAYNRVLSAAEIGQIYQREAGIADRDNDGVNDYREGKDGTDPADPASFDPLSKRLFAYYPLNGDTVDESGNGLNGRNFGAAVSTDRAGRAGRAYSFDGTSRIDLPFAQGIVTEYTVTAWFKTTGGGIVLGANHQEKSLLFGVGKSASGFGENSGRAYAMLSANPGVAIGKLSTNATQAIDGKWRHLAGVFASVDGDIVEPKLFKVFIDGVEVQSIENTSGQVNSAIVSPLSATNLFSIGTHKDGWNSPGFVGDLDEVRIYDRALSNAEIGQIYQREAGALDTDADGVTDYREGEDGTDPKNAASYAPLSRGLVAYYPFDGSLNDDSGFGADGINAGATTAADRNGVAGRAIFLGGSQHVKVPDSAALPVGAAPRTLSLWVRSLNGSRGVNAAHVANWGSVDHARAFGQMVFLANTWWAYGHSTNPVLGAQVDTDSGVPAGTLWSHVATTYDGTNMSIYVDGIFAASRSVALNTVGPDLYFGARPDLSNFFSGHIDDTRIYNRALSSVEIEQLYVAEAGNLDTDNDGLTDAAEFLLEGLGFNRRTNNAAQVLGLFNNPNNALLYTLAQYNANRTNGRTDVTTNPSAFNLYTQAQYDAFGALRFSNGVASVATNPSSSGLFTQAQYDAFGAQRFSNGQTSVTTNPSAFGLFTQVQFDSNRLAGRADVTSAPANFSLFTLAQFNANRTNGRTDVTTNPSAFNLFTQAQYDVWGATNYHLGRLATATRTAYEGFRYAPDNLAGLAAGTGWSGAWNVVGGSVTNSGFCLSNSLNYTDSNGLKLLVSGGRARTSMSDVGVMRTFGRGLSNGTIYLGLLMKGINTAGINSYGGIALFSSDDKERLFFGEMFNHTNGLGLVAYTTNAVPFPGSCGAIASDETKFIVLKVEFNAGATAGNERITVYINPSLQAEKSAATYYFPDVPSFDFSKIRVQSGGGSPLQLVEVDEIRLGTTYGAVAPVDDDADGDGLLSGAELDGGTDPEKYDTNGDGLPDGQAAPPTPTPIPAPQVQSQPTPAKAPAKKAKPKPKPKPKPKLKSAPKKA